MILNIPLVCFGSCNCKVGKMQEEAQRKHVSSPVFRIFNVINASSLHK